MTVPAHLAACGHLLHIAHAARLYKLCVQLRVATDAVVHHHLARQGLGLDSLMLHVTYEISRVLQTVDRLEAIING